jgi:hypothetical protein
MLATFFLSHAWWFFFDPRGAEWYEGNVYGNLVAIVPTGLIFFLYLRSRHLAVIAAHEEMKAAHVEHAEKLDKLLDKLDPSSDGGIADVHAAIAEVKDALDPVTPGGLHVVVERLDDLKPKSPGGEP